MAVSDGDRLDLYESVRDNWGERSAQTLMEYLPPIGWSDVARQSDVTALRADTAAGFADVRGEMAELRAEMRTGFAEVRCEMASEFGNVRCEMASEFGNVRGEMAELRTETRTGLADVRGEMATGLAELRVEMHQGFNRQLVWLVTTVFGAVALVVSVIAYVG